METKYVTRKFDLIILQQRGIEVNCELNYMIGYPKVTTYYGIKDFFKFLE